jgi:hypothetical protein
LAWKLAAWGSHLDARLLKSVCRRNKHLGDLEAEGLLRISQGLELRNAAADEELEHHPELEGTLVLDLGPLKRMRKVFAFPEGALKSVKRGETYVRKGRFEVPYGVCIPPHLIVGASRTFAIYSDKFVIVPARQIGIASSSRDLLKAVALLLNSDFAMYQQVLFWPYHTVFRCLGDGYEAVDKDCCCEATLTAVWFLDFNG